MSAEKPAGATLAVAKGKHLTERQKTQACLLWASGDVTLEDLAKRFGKSKKTFERLFKARGVAKGERRDEVREEVRSAAAASERDEAAETLKRIKETKDDHYKMAKGLAALTWKELVDARNAKVQIAVHHANIKALKDAAATLQMILNQRYTVLGLMDGGGGDGGELVDLVIQELSNEQVRELHRMRQREERSIPDLPDLRETSVELPEDDSPDRA